MASNSANVPPDLVSLINKDLPDDVTSILKFIENEDNVSNRRISEEYFKYVSENIKFINKSEDEYVTDIAKLNIYELIHCYLKLQDFKKLFYKFENCLKANMSFVRNKTVCPTCGDCIQFDATKTLLENLKEHEHIELLKKASERNISGNIDLSFKKQKYDDNILSEVYPTDLMEYIKNVEGSRTFTIQVQNEFHLRCLLCDCYIKRTIFNNLYSHIKGKLHLNNLKEKRFSLNVYHNYWMNVDPQLQHLQTRFIPIDRLQTKCTTCKIIMHYNNIFEHIYEHDIGNQIHLAITNDVDSTHWKVQNIYAIGVENELYPKILLQYVQTIENGKNFTVRLVNKSVFECLLCKCQFLVNDFIGFAMHVKGNEHRFLLLNEVYVVTKYHENWSQLDPQRQMMQVNFYPCDDAHSECIKCKKTLCYRDFQKQLRKHKCKNQDKDGMLMPSSKSNPSELAETTQKKNKNPIQRESDFGSSTSSGDSIKLASPKPTETTQKKNENQIQRESDFGSSASSGDSIKSATPKPTETTRKKNENQIERESDSGSLASCGDSIKSTSPKPIETGLKKESQIKAESDSVSIGYESRSCKTIAETGLKKENQIKAKSDSVSISYKSRPYKTIADIRDQILLDISNGNENIKWKIPNIYSSKVENELYPKCLLQYVQYIENSKTFNVRFINKSLFECLLCDCHFILKNFIDFISHLKGKRHKRLLKNDNGKIEVYHRNWMQIDPKHQMMQVNFIPIDIAYTTCIICNIPVPYTKLQNHLQIHGTGWKNVESQIKSELDVDWLVAKDTSILNTPNPPVSDEWKKTEKQFQTELVSDDRSNLNLPKNIVTGKWNKTENQIEGESDTNSLISSTDTSNSNSHNHVETESKKTENQSESQSNSHLGTVKNILEAIAKGDESMQWDKPNIYASSVENILYPKILLQYVQNIENSTTFTVRLKDNSTITCLLCSCHICVTDYNGFFAHLKGKKHNSNLLNKINMVTNYHENWMKIDADGQMLQIDFIPCDYLYMQCVPCKHTFPYFILENHLQEHDTLNEIYFSIVNDDQNIQWETQNIYESKIENKLYPKSLLQYVQSIENSNTFTVRLKNKSIITCLLCKCEFPMNNFANFIVHLKGRRHKLFLQNCINDVAKYHENWIKMDPERQMMQVDFVPCDCSYTACTKCRKILLYSNLAHHLDKHTPLNKLNSTSFVSQDVNGHEVKEENELESQIKYETNVENKSLTKPKQLANIETTHIKKKRKSLPSLIQRINEAEIRQKKYQDCKSNFDSSSSSRESSSSNTHNPTGTGLQDIEKRIRMLINNDIEIRQKMYENQVGKSDFDSSVSSRESSSSNTHNPTGTGLQDIEKRIKGESDDRKTNSSKHAENDLNKTENQFKSETDSDSLISYEDASKSNSPKPTGAVKKFMEVMQWDVPNIYTSKVENILYPKMLLQYVQNIENSTTFTVRLKDNSTITCLLCVCRISVTDYNALVSHLKGKRHSLNLLNKINTVKNYHENWMKIDADRQLLQTDFIPYDDLCTKCVSCHQILPYLDLVNHLNEHNTLNEIFFAIVNDDQTIQWETQNIYEYKIQNELYPKRLLQYVQSIENCNTFTVRLKNKTIITCLLCNSEFSLNSFTNFIIHLKGKTHTLFLHNRISKVEKYHENWMKMDPERQMMQVDFIPCDNVYTRCKKCKETLPYSNLAHHLDKHALLNKLNSTSFINQDVNGHGVKEENELESQIKYSNVESKLSPKLLTKQVENIETTHVKKKSMSSLQKKYENQVGKSDFDSSVSSRESSNSNAHKPAGTGLQEIDKLIKGESDDNSLESFRDGRKSNSPKHAGNDLNKTENRFKSETDTDSLISFEDTSKSNSPKPEETHLKIIEDKDESDSDSLVSFRDGSKSNSPKPTGEKPSSVKSKLPFFFKFNIRYDSQVEDKYYPGELLKNTICIDNINYPIFRVFRNQIVCMVCKKSPFITFIEEHILSTKHYKSLKDPNKLSKFKRFHDFWMRQEVQVQLEQKHFKCIKSQLKCYLCDEVMSYESVIEHIGSSVHERFTRKPLNRSKTENTLGEDDTSDMENGKIILNSTKLVIAGTSKDNAPKTAHNIRKSVPDLKCTNILQRLPLRFRDHLQFLVDNIDSVTCTCCAQTLQYDISVIYKHVCDKNHLARTKLLNTKFTYCCEICFKTYGVEESWSNHLKNDQHLQRLASLLRKDDVHEYECLTCLLVIFGNSATFQRHQERKPRPPPKKKIKTIKLSEAVRRLFESEEILEQKACSLLLQATCEVQDLEKEKKCCMAFVTVLRNIFPLCEAYPFGSRVTGLGNKDSDMDLFVDVGDMYHGNILQSPDDQFKIVKKVCKELRKWKDFSHINEVPWARTPIIQVFHVGTDIDCDVSFRHGLSVENTSFIRFCIDIQPMFQKLVLVLKKWSSYCNLTSNLSSYALTMMAIFYLQTQGYLLSIKRLREINSKIPPVIDGWQTITYTASLETMKKYIMPCEYSTKDLLLHFFSYYKGFDTNTLVICPLLGHGISKSLFENNGKYLPPEMESYVKRIKNPNAERFRNLSPLCVQDPFDLSHNLTKAISAEFVKKIKTLFELSEKHLSALTKNDKNVC